MFSLILLVNDDSGRLPAYRGLVDAVQSIVRTGGLKGLYQVSKINFTVKTTLCLETGLFVLIQIKMKLVSLAVNSARKNRSHFGNFEQSFHNYATVKG